MKWVFVKKILRNSDPWQSPYTHQHDTVHRRMYIYYVIIYMLFGIFSLWNFNCCTLLQADVASFWLANLENYNEIEALTSNTQGCI